MLKEIFLIIIGFSGGFLISGSIFAFLAVIGIVPSLAQKTNTQNHIILYEEALIFGGILGAITSFIDISIELNNFFIILLGLLEGIFIGCLAIELAEVLDVIPVLSRRVCLKKGLNLLIISIAFGKMIGSLVYYFYPGFK